MTGQIQWSRLDNPASWYPTETLRIYADGSHQWINSAPNDCIFVIETIHANGGFIENVPAQTIARILDEAHMMLAPKQS